MSGWDPAQNITFTYVLCNTFHEQPEGKHTHLCGVSMHVFMYVCICMQMQFHVCVCGGV